MLIPVVLGDVDPGQIEDLIGLGVRYRCIRTHGRPDSQDDPAPSAGRAPAARLLPQTMCQSPPG
jgi:hypothetical protein